MIKTVPVQQYGRKPIIINNKTLNKREALRKFNELINNFIEAKSQQNDFPLIEEALFKAVIGAEYDEDIFEGYNRPLSKLAS